MLPTTLRGLSVAAGTVQPSLFNNVVRALSYQRWTSGVAELCSTRPQQSANMQQEQPQGSMQNATSYTRWQPSVCSSSIAGWQCSRGFASKAAPSKAASGDAGPPKRFVRRSHVKLYSVRNSRVRSQFEQIWPTLKLTEEEQQLFRRSSRVFVTELGRAISLQQKFNLAKAGDSKVPHTDARSMLYESDIHLDAVGEHPRYLKIRRLRGSNYAAKLESVRKLRMLLGMVRRGELQSLYEQSVLQPGPDRTWKLVCAMEGRYGMTALRMGLAHDAMGARGFLKHGNLFVNGARPAMPYKEFIQPGDIMSVAPWSKEWHQQYMAGQMGPEVMESLARSWLGGDKERRPRARRSDMERGPRA